MTFAPATVIVEQGETVAHLARELAQARVITTSLPFRIILRISGGDGKVQTGTYRFDEPENVFSVARRLLTGDYGLPAVKLTFTEGVTVREMAMQVSKSFPAIREQDFLATARASEGYLFPDTYVFPASTGIESLIARMRSNFDVKTTTILEDLSRSKHSLADIVIVASLIEKEARTEESRRLVSGILWNRLERNMPLQVDAVFGYIFNRPTYSPSPSDLKVDSPYNTYLNKGLPPGPINNPGLAALEAAANPTATKYLYYLTGNDGEMYYAITYAGHKANVQKYLK